MYKWYNDDTTKMIKKIHWYSDYRFLGGWGRALWKSSILIHSLILQMKKLESSNMFKVSKWVKGNLGIMLGSHSRGVILQYTHFYSGFICKGCHNKSPLTGWKFILSQFCRLDVRMEIKVSSGPYFLSRLWGKILLPFLASGNSGQSWVFFGSNCIHPL